MSLVLFTDCRLLFTRAAKCFVLPLLLSAPVASLSWSAASDQSFTYQGRFMNEDGTAPLNGTIDITFAIFEPNPAGTCLLYEETQAGIDLDASDGYVSLYVGSAQGAARRTARDPGKSMAQIFSNRSEIRASGSPDCADGYTPQVNDGRRLHVIVKPHAGAPVALSPDLEITGAPMAAVAQSLQGFGPADFLKTSTHATQLNIEALVGGANASSLHKHDDLYAKLGELGGKGLNLAGVGAGVGEGKSLRWDATAEEWVTYTPAAGGGTVTQVTGTSPVVVTNGTTTPSISVGYAGPAAAGILSAADYQTLSGKQSSSLTSGYFWVGNGSNAATAVQLSGDATLANDGALTLKDTGTAGTYTKVTTDAKGRVTSGASLALGDLPRGSAGNIGFPLLSQGAGGDVAFGALDLSSTAVTGLPDCQDSSGNHLNYNSTTKAFSCGSSSSAGGEWSAVAGGIAYSAGNVGIGTTSPAAPLEVQSANVGHARLGYNVGGSGGMSYAIHGTAISIAGSAYGVYGSTGSNPDTTAYGLGAALDNTSGTALMISSGNVTTGRMIAVKQNTSAFSGDVLFVNVADGSGSFTGNFVDFKKGGATEFKVTGDGNVGIGTATPEAKLHVVGASGTTLKIVDGNQGNGKVLTSDANGVASWADAPSAPVSSVAGRTGAVTLSNTDISGLGTAATLNVGTGANNVVQLNGSSQLPAIDGSLLTGINASKLSGSSVSISGAGAGDYLRHNGTDWVNATLATADVQTALGAASGTNSGYLSSADWTAFNKPTSLLNTGGTASQWLSGISAAGAPTYSQPAFSDISGTLGVAQGGTGATSLTAHGVLVGNGTGTLATTGVGTAGQVLTSNGPGADPTWQELAGGQWGTGASSSINYMAGNVGIGTTTPAKMLEIFGASNGLRLSYDAAKYVDLRADSVGHLSLSSPLRVNSNIIYFSGTDANQKKALSLASNNTVLSSPGTASSPGVLIFETGNSSTERMRIDDTGNVGIGTSAPAGRLVVSAPAGYAENLLDLEVDGASQLFVDAYGALAASRLSADATITGPVVQGSFAASGNLTLDSTGHATKGNVLINPSGGKVGIGTATPGTKLEVVGTSGTTLKIVDGNQGNGKVLTSDANGVASWADAPSAPVTTVAGRTGAVTLSNTDISGLGTAATLNVGTGANNVVQLNGSSQLPAIDGSLLTGINASKLSGSSVNISGAGAADYLRHNGADWVNATLATADVQTALGAASGTNSGYLSSADWTAFNKTTSLLNTGGTASQWLSGISAAGAPTYSQPTFSDISGTVGVAQGGTGATTLTAHGVLVGNGTGTLATTGVGTAGQVLTSNGPGADPTWQELSGGQWSTGASSSINYMAGNVGIGTVSPDEKLEIYQGNLKLGDNSNNTFGLVFERNGTEIGRIDTTRSRLEVSSGLAVNGNLSLYGGVSRGIVFDDGGSDTDYWMSRVDSDGDGETNNDTLQIGVGTTIGTSPALTINPLGRVGIGTTDPLQSLHVVGGTPRFQSTNGTQSIFIDAASGGYDASVLLANGGTTKGKIYYKHSNTAITITDATNTDLMTLKAGNVGIGTATPGTKLEVAGTSGTTLKIVDGNQGNGKVLTSDANGVASWADAPSAPVASVAGRTGAVTLSNTDISGLGTAATLNTGTGADNVLKLNASSQIPAVDGSLLTGVNASKLSGSSLNIAAPGAGDYLRHDGTSWVNTALPTADVQTALGVASGTNSGYLASVDWTAFNKCTSLLNTGGTASRWLSSISAAGAPTYSQPAFTDISGTLGVAQGGTGATTLTAHGVLVGNGTGAVAATGVGTAGQVLTSNGPGADPTWQALSAGNWSTGGSSSINYTTGNVGIGTTAPANMLEVNGVVAATATSLAAGSYTTLVSGNATNDFANASNREFRVQAVNDGSGYSQYLLYDGRITGSLDSPIYNQGSYGRFAGIEFASGVGSQAAAGSISFLTNTGGAGSGSNTVIMPTRALTIENTGNIGIGTTTPAGILDVNGGTAAAGAAGTPISLTAQGGGAGNAAGGDIVLTGGTPTGTGNAGSVKVKSRAFVTYSSSITSPWTSIEHSSGASYSGTLNVFTATDDYRGAIHAASYGGGAHQYAIIGLRQNSTVWNGVGGAVTNGDTLPGIGFAGQTVTGNFNKMVLGAAVQGVVDGAVSDLVLPTGIKFSTTTTNSAGLAEQMRLSSAGELGIKTSTPKATLDVNGTARLARYAAAPHACDADRDGVLAATSKYTLCICKNGTGWVSTNDGATGCTWN